MSTRPLSRDTHQVRKRRTTRWQAAFPLHWDADELLSRREMLRWTVMASGALFAGTAATVGLGYIHKPNTAALQQAIVRASEVPVGGVHYFHYPTAEDQAILLHLTDGNFVAYSGKCTHLSCAVFYEQERDELYCPCHEGIFETLTGEVVAGPPPRALPKITVKQDGEMLYAVEEQPQ